MNHNESHTNTWIPTWKRNIVHRGSHSRAWFWILRWILMNPDWLGISERTMCPFTEFQLGVDDGDPLSTWLLPAVLWFIDFYNFWWFQMTIEPCLPMDTAGSICPFNTCGDWQMHCSPFIIPLTRTFSMYLWSLYFLFTILFCICLSTILVCIFYLLSNLSFTLHSDHCSVLSCWYCCCDLVNKISPIKIPILSCDAY